MTRFPRAAAALILVHVALTAVVCLSMAPTVDEPAHLEYGRRILGGDASRPHFYLNSKMPVTAWNALPVAFGLGGLKAARLMNLPLLALFDAIVWLWARQLWGDRTALGALLLCVLAPNLTAHAALVTTDFWFVLAVTATAYLHWRGDDRNAALALAASLLTKPTALLLLPLAVLGLRRNARVYAPALALGSIGLLYFFFGFRGFPLPEHYVDGLRMTMHDARTGESNGGYVYLLGELRHMDPERYSGFPLYFWATWLVKEPLATLALFAAGLRFLGGRWFLLIPVVITPCVLAASSLQIGFRHALPMVPFTILIAAQALARLPRAAAGALLAAQLLSVAFYFPHLVPYTNELIPEKRLAYRVLADSNLDWGQNWYAVQRYVAAHPDVHGCDGPPCRGRILLGVNDFVGLRNAAKYAWLRESGVEPVAHVEHGSLIFELP